MQFNREEHLSRGHRRHLIGFRCGIARSQIMQSFNTVSSFIIIAFTAVSLMLPSAQAITLYPHESCNKVQRYVARQMEDCQHVIEKPLIISGGQCHAEGVTTLSDYPTLMHRDFMALASLQTSYIENNYR